MKYVVICHSDRYFTEAVIGPFKSRKNAEKWVRKAEGCPFTHTIKELQSPLS